MRQSRVMVRSAALGAVVLAALVLLIVVLSSGSDSYTYKAIFQNASQLVTGDLVQTAGVKVGSVDKITLTPNGQAEVQMTVDKPYAPLRYGTQAIVRQASLSGIANRYIDLQLAPGNAPKIGDNGVIDPAHTSTAVDLDQIFNLFDAKRRRSLSQLIQGFARTYAGRDKQANAALAYLNPSVAATSLLFQELNRDTALFRRFINANGNLFTDLASRQADLTGLISNLDRTTGAIGRQRAALTTAVGVLPSFMQHSVTTFAGLRTTLDDLQPLVDESKPVAKKLVPFLAELRPFAQGAQPTIHNLAALLRAPGPNNDLVELTQDGIAVRDIAVKSQNVNGKTRPGAFPVSTDALSKATPELNFARPYAVDLTGWFNDFSTPGIIDALGGASRAAPYVNAFAVAQGALVPVPASLREALFKATAQVGQNDRCPGAAERPLGGANWVPTPGYECDPTQLPPGP
jgi:phospholipid/cholesterol/gamma-HCH transport system substrate-binding protein